MIKHSLPQSARLRIEQDIAYHKQKVAQQQAMPPDGYDLYRQMQGRGIQIKHPLRTFNWIHEPMYANPLDARYYRGEYLDLLTDDEYTQLETEIELL